MRGSHATWEVRSSFSPFRDADSIMLTAKQDAADLFFARQA